MRLVQTTRFRRGKLPHWEVENGRYFVTVRLADSLPAAAVTRLQAVHQSLQAIGAQSIQFTQLQREYFAVMEKYLDAGSGACLLTQNPSAQNVSEELQRLEEWEVMVPHYTIMPNHWHALLAPGKYCPHSLSEIMKRVKGRTAKAIRRIAGGAGPVWQREWFDRWIRDDNEWERFVRYIQQNPVKARLVDRPEDHPWTR